MSSSLKEEKISGDIVYEGYLLKIHKDKVKLPNGKVSVREYIHHPGAVVVLPFLENGNVILEKQYRYPANQVFIECPAGKIDPGESLEETAHRELLEETGYTCKTLSYLGKVHPGIGYTDEVIYLYEGFGLTHQTVNRDDDEFLEIFQVPFKEAYQMVLSGEITDAKSMVAILLSWERKKSREDEKDKDKRKE
ncbi:MAG: NUDIX hydrolase [Candidatus Marinimicrobia bacterium]|nr:NUDIX hydrolase [Candidatus Neomarinimicrobiota bacterium]MDD5582561.1 NUDIX hydrolase [Candidatus Neomarinimicrobiota bacterium]